MNDSLVERRLSVDECPSVVNHSEKVSTIFRERQLLGSCMVLANLMVRPDRFLSETKHNRLSSTSVHDSQANPRRMHGPVGTVRKNGPSCTVHLRWTEDFLGVTS